MIEKADLDNMEIKEEINIKKYFIYLLILLSLLITGCSSQVDDSFSENILVTENTVKRDDYHNRQYDEWVISIGNIEYHIEKGNIPSQEEAENLAKKLHEKVKLLQSKLNLNENERKISIHIVKTNVKTGKELPFAYYDIDLDTVYLQKDQIDDLFTLKALAELVYDIHIPWLTFGIAGDVSGYEVNEDELCSFYSDADHLDTLGLFGARFYEKANEEVETAIQTAVSFYRYLVSKYEEDVWQKIKASDTDLDVVYEKQEWLKSIGCNLEYHPSYGDEIMNYSCFYHNDYDLMVQSGYADFYVKLYNKDNSFIKNSFVLERLLYHNLDSYNRYMELAHKENFEEYLTKEIFKVYINEESGQNRTITMSDSHEVLLFNWSIEFVHAHELAHAILENNYIREPDGRSLVWLNEGYATYISATLPLENSTAFQWSGESNCDFYYMKMQKMRENNFDGTTYTDIENAAAFEKAFWDYYNEDGMLKDQSDFDRIRYIEAFTKAYINTQNLDVDNPDTPYELYASFTKYVVEKYSWRDLVYLANSNAPMEDVLGKTFEKLIIEWKRLYMD